MQRRVRGHRQRSLNNVSLNLLARRTFAEKEAIRVKCSHNDVVGERCRDFRIAAHCDVRRVVLGHHDDDGKRQRSTRSTAAGDRSSYTQNHDAQEAAGQLAHEIKYGRGFSFIEPTVPHRAKPTTSTAGHYHEPTRRIVGPIALTPRGGPHAWTSSHTLCLSP